MKSGIGRNVHVIYAGGDDLFTLGSWSDVAALANDISEAFNTYTCGSGNIDLGISGGLTLHHAKFPVSKFKYRGVIHWPIIYYRDLSNLCA